MANQNTDFEAVEVDLARIISVEKASFLNFKLIVSANGKWRIVTSSAFPGDRRLAGQYGTLYEKDLPKLKSLVAQAEEAVNKIGRFSRPVNVPANPNTEVAQFVAKAIMTCGLSVLYEIAKQPKIHPRTVVRLGSVGALNFSVVSEEPKRAFVSTLVLGSGSRNAAAGVTLDAKGFERLKQAVRLIESTVKKLDGGNI